MLGRCGCWNCCCENCCEDCWLETGAVFSMNGLGFCSKVCGFFLCSSRACQLMNQKGCWSTGSLLRRSTRSLSPFASKGSFTVVVETSSSPNLKGDDFDTLETKFLFFLLLYLHTILVVRLGHYLGFGTTCHSLLNLLTLKYTG